MNPHTLPETLAELAADEDVEVRDTVASSIRTPERALRLLAFDDDWQVRLNVANNANTPEDTLRKLLKDEFLVVREAALNNPSYQPRLTERCDEATEAVSALNIQNQPSARRDGR
jgi:hypothetical protein